MEEILGLAMLLIIFLIVNGNSRLQEKIRHLEQSLNMMEQHLQKLRFRPDTAEKSPIKENTHEEPKLNDPLRWSPPKIVEPPKEPEKTTEIVTPEISPKETEKFDLPEAKPAPVTEPENTIIQSSVVVSRFPKTQNIPPPIPPPIPPKPGFFERNPDLEKFIGENLVSKIGIAILVLAIGYFVKYAIDQDWIGPAGRVGIGILCGGILIGLAHRMHQNYKAFSSVLVGGGLAIFYFTIALAYKDYGLFSQTVAFIIMVVITIFAILLSLLYDRQEVAIIALIGGFAVPFMVSNGSGNYVTLFTYLLLLNTGLLVIAYRKAWRLLNAIAFGATVLIFAAWLTNLESNKLKEAAWGALVFATAFYLLFLAINLAHNIKEQKKFIASDFGILLVNTALYFSVGIYLLVNADAANYKGLFCISVAVLNFLLTLFLVRRSNVDKSILYLFVGLTLTFVSLTAPLQLNGHFITLFWCAESVILLWLLQRTEMKILQYGLLIVWICSLISLSLDWSMVYGYSGQSRILPLANKGFITTLFAALCNTVIYKLLQRQASPGLFNVMDIQLVKRIFGTVALVLFFAAGAFETAYQFGQYYPNTGLSGLYLHLYVAIFLLLLWLLNRRKLLRFQGLLLFMVPGAAVIINLVATPITLDVQHNLLINGLHNSHFIAHWLTAAITAFLFIKLNLLLRTDKLLMELYGPLITWASAAVAVIYVSVESYFCCNWLFYHGVHSIDILDANFVKIGLPIVWGMCSFAMMWLGMRHKYRTLRIVSLSLFSITLFKLFLFDIQSVGVAGKIAAFFCLGVLLLLVSFMYQRLKKLIIEDEPGKKME